MKIFFSFFVLYGFLVTGLWAQTATGVTCKFTGQEDDPYDVVKAQLEYLCLRESISAELSGLGLDSASFWLKFDERFDEQFKIQAEKLDLTKVEDRKVFLTSKTQFGQLKRVVRSFAIKSLTKDNLDKRVRFMRYEAKLDRAVVQQIFRQYVSAQNSKIFETLFISLNINLESGQVEDLGVANLEELSLSVKQSWKKWFEENYQNISEKIVLASDSDDQRLENVLKSDEGGSASTLWFRAQVKIIKSANNNSFSEKNLKFQGDCTLIDVGSKNYLSTTDIPTTHHRFSFERQSQLSSKVASLIYRWPLENLALAKKKQNLGQSKSDTIILKGFASLLDVKEFLDLLEQKGASLSTQVQVSTLRGNDYEARVLYQGDELQLKQFLSSISGQAFKEKKITLEGDSSPFSFIIK
jgi:hypothetical protein